MSNEPAIGHEDEKPTTTPMPSIGQDDSLAVEQDARSETKPTTSPMPSIVQSTYVRFGIVPSPEEIEHYIQLMPDAGERFFAYAEQEQAARHKAMQNEDERKMKLLEMQVLNMKEEEKLIALHGRNSLIGLLAGFVIAVIVCIFTFLLILRGHDVAAGVFGGTSVVGLVSALIYGSHVSRREILSQKEK